MLQTLLGREKYEWAMSDEHPPFDVNLLKMNEKTVRSFELDNIGKKKRYCKNVKILRYILW